MPKDPREDYAPAVQYIVRELAADLTPAETVCLLFVVDRTLAWGKAGEVIPKRHFTEGAGRAGRGTGLSQPTVRRALASLAECGLLRAEPRGEGGSRANFYTPMIPIPKRLKSEKFDTPQSEKSDTPKVKNLTPPTKELKNKLTLSKGSAPFPKGRDPVKEKIEEGKKKSISSAERRAARTPGTEAQVAAAWAEAAGEGAKKLTARDAAALRSYGVRFTAAFKGRPPFREFLAYAVARWADWRAELFGWMRRPPAPADPSPRFLIAHANDVEAWAKVQEPGWAEPGVLSKHAAPRRRKSAKLAEGETSGSVWVDMEEAEARKTGFKKGPWD